MTEWLQRVLALVRDSSIRSGRALQRWIVTVLLFLLYLFGMGLTKLMCLVFFRRHLRLYRTDRSARTFWKDVEPYSPDLESLRRQF